MEFRFRYLAAEGGEVEVSSLEQLRGLVQSGAVGELTLLYDALTREWAPARSHAVYRFIRDEAGRGGAPKVPAPAASRPDELDLGMTLSLEAMPTPPDADESVRELLRQRERETDPDRRESVLAHDGKPLELTGVGSPSSSASSPAPEPTTGAATPARTGPFVFTTPVPTIPWHPPQRAAEGDPTPEGRPALFIERGTAAPGGPRVDPLPSWLNGLGQALMRGVGPRTIPGTLLLGGLIGLVVVMLATVRTESVDAAAGSPQAASMSLGPAPAGGANPFASAQEAAFLSLVAGVDSLRYLHNVVTVPPIWLEGKYLADAQQYPEVMEFFGRYQTFLREVEATDTALFRAGFVRSLEEQGIEGAVLSLRLGQALREFEASQPRRADVYRHMQDLSAAALELHALLEDRAADITYEPALQRGVSREPVVEAVAEDTLLKDHMWTVLERIFASLEWLGGDFGGSRDNLTARLLEGIAASAH